MVRKDSSGKLITPCGGRWEFCEAFRSDWGQALADEGMYVGNLFERDLYEWDQIADHHDLVRGYVLEKFFIETHPKHKLATMRAYGGLAGAEFEARDAPLFFEKYLSQVDFDEPRHYLLAYELQRRFFVRDNQGSIGKARNLASAIHRQQSKFKPLRDAVHNQISAAHIPRIQAYRQVAEVSSFKELGKLEKNWRDRFGPCPPSAQNLLSVAELRVAASNARISACEIQEDKLMLTRNGKWIHVDGKFPRLKGDSREEILADAISMAKSL